MSLIINQAVTFSDTKGSTLEGFVHKLNPKKAHVKITRGNHRFAVGQIICVPYRLLGFGDYGRGAVAPHVPVQAAPPVHFEPTEWWVRDNALELMILDGLFGELSPENLCCDGEASHSHIMQKRRDIERRMQAVFVLLGTQIDESTHYEIMDKFRAEIIKSLQQSIQWQERLVAIPSMT